MLESEQGHLPGQKELVWSLVVLFAALVVRKFSLCSWHGWLITDPSTEIK